MVAVRCLEYRYLWVDKYCMDHGNEASKNAQINNMDSIYSGAHATIFAVGVPVLNSAYTAFRSLGSHNPMPRQVSDLLFRLYRTFHPSSPAQSGFNVAGRIKKPS
jgi:Heterokaryon incompatibility protein (HET)